jgi:DNA-binding NarL/FixJ family response regulator
VDQHLPIKVAAADDHPLVRAGLAAVIAVEPDMTFLGEAANGQDAVALYRLHRPDVMLIDLRMPVMDGVSATRTIVSEFPDARIIKLSMSDGDGETPRA